MFTVRVGARYTDKISGQQDVVFIHLPQNEEDLLHTYGLGTLKLLTYESMYTIPFEMSDVFELNCTVQLLGCLPTEMQRDLKLLCEHYQIKTAQVLLNTGWSYVFYKGVLDEYALGKYVLEKQNRQNCSRDIYVEIGRQIKNDKRGFFTPFGFWCEIGYDNVEYVRNRINKWDDFIERCCGER